MELIKSDKIRNFIPDMDFWKKILMFSVPIALQNMSSAILGIIDTSIISGMGETAVAAVSLATQLFYIVSLITFGITSGASVYLARHYGEKNPVAMRKTFSLMMSFSMAINLIIMLFCLFLPRTALGFFTNDIETIKSGAVYLIIITPTFLLYSLSNSYVAFFRAVNQPKTPMIATIVSLSVKTILNFVLIYGMGFIPAMGVAGAAFSTLISKIVEAIIYLACVIKFKQKEYLFKFRDIRFVKPKATFEFIR